MSGGESITEAMTRRTIRIACRWIAARRLELTVEGGEHVPAAGPALIAARHFHHLYDGCALIAALPRPVSLLVALDWVDSAVARQVMERACRLARWPVVLRAEALERAGSGSAFRRAEVGRYLRRAAAESVDLLRSGQLLVVFPEGYPTIDPAGALKPDEDTLLPFRPGFARLVELAERGGDRIPIIPAGFVYERGARWQVRLRFGQPLFAGRRADRGALVRAVEEQVSQCSQAAPKASAAAW
jgi:putative membrane protein